MKIGRPCPFCGAEVKIWSDFSRVLSAVSCPNCQARLRFELSRSLLVVGFALYFVLFILFERFLREAGLSSARSLIAVLISWFGTDLLMTAYVRSTRALVRTEEPR